MSQKTVFLIVTAVKTSNLTIPLMPNIPFPKFVFVRCKSNSVENRTDNKLLQLKCLVLSCAVSCNVPCAEQNEAQTALPLALRSDLPSITGLYFFTSVAPAPRPSYSPHNTGEATLRQLRCSLVRCSLFVCTNE
jgi:hypothetical protein